MFVRNTDRLTGHLICLSPRFHKCYTWLRHRLRLIHGSTYNRSSMFLTRGWNNTLAILAKEPSGLGVTSGPHISPLAIQCVVWAGCEHLTFIHIYILQPHLVLRQRHGFNAVLPKVVALILLQCQISDVKMCVALRLWISTSTSSVSFPHWARYPISKLHLFEK